MGAINTNMRKAALAALRHRVLPSFEERFGPAEHRPGPAQANGGDFAFDPAGTPFVSLRAFLSPQKKILGGVFGFTLEAVMDRPASLLDAGDLRLCYRGALVKGEPYFKAERDPQGGELAGKLLADARLKKLLQLQDLEDMRLVNHDGRLAARFTPIGGSFVYMVLPPMKYAVKLPGDHARALAEAALRLAERLGCPTTPLATPDIGSNAA